MVYDYFDKYTFLCDMYEEESDSIVELIFDFFPFDNSVRVTNAKRGMSLLKRTQIPSLKINMLQIGNTINVFSKLLLLRDCAQHTQKTLFNNFQSTFAMIKPVPASIHGKIITYIMEHGFNITRLKNAKLDKDFAIELYSHISGSNNMPIIVDYVTSGDVVGLELVGPDAVSAWRKCLGATDPRQAEPGTVRYLYGENTLRNAAHGCNSLEESQKILELFFGYKSKGVPRMPFRATFENCTCCIIKPHAVIDGKAGAILEQISTAGKFYISAMAMFTVKLIDAEEFYEVYKGLLPEYNAMAIQLAEGRCIALEVKSTDPSVNVVCEFRKLCGPRDPDVCRQLYPDTIRARFGVYNVHNAVHATDLPEDGELEIEYFFKFLANS